MLRGIQTFKPSSQTFAEIDIYCVNPFAYFAEAYGADVDDLTHEFHRANRLLQRMEVEDRPTALVGFISHIERYGIAFAENQLELTSAVQGQLFIVCCCNN